MGSTGVAKSEPYNCDTEDTITLLVQWENLKVRILCCSNASTQNNNTEKNILQSHNQGIAVYTASWAAPPSDVHSQQRFHYMGHKGEISVDQAHRGYTVATDQDGFASVNPLYMKYTPDEDGNFAGQNGY